MRGRNCKYSLEDWEKVAPYATPTQRPYLEAFIASGGDMAATCDTLGKPRSTVSSYLSRVMKRAAQRGVAPAEGIDTPTPSGYLVKGVSTLYGPEGEVKARWVKTDRETERSEALLEALRSELEQFRGAEDPVPETSGHRDSDLLAVYPMGDPHVGMYAWAAEAGENFDLETAERDLLGAVDRLVSLAPPAKEALIINLGDFFHADTPANRTERSGHALDVDGRWAKVLVTGIRIMKRAIRRALEKHERVTVINEIGNHDSQSAIMLGIALAEQFEREPRVRIDTSPQPFHWYRFGSCLLGTHHGHSVKSRDLPAVMACDRAEDWGETRYRHWYTGHVHHETVKEYAGVTVETFRNLAPNDAWHHGEGYRSQKDMRLDVWHRDYGRINRHIVGISQIRAGMAA